MLTRNTLKTHTPENPFITTVSRSSPINPSNFDDLERAGGVRYLLFKSKYGQTGATSLMALYKRVLDHKSNDLSGLSALEIKFSSLEVLCFQSGSGQLPVRKKKSSVLKIEFSTVIFDSQEVQLEREIKRFPEIESVYHLYKMITRRG